MDVNGADRDFAAAPAASSADVAGLSVVVVGGTTGLGWSGALALRRAGACVTVVGRDAGNLGRALDALGEDGAAGLEGDASDPRTAEAAVALACERFGRLDAIYHVAGGSGRSEGDGPLHDLTDEGWRFTVDLNLSSIVYSNRAAVRCFRDQGGGGAILNMGSVLGFSPSPRYFASHAYAAAKSAVIGFTRSIAAYYAAEGIRANVVAPALVETPMSRRASGDEEILGFIRTKQPLDGGRNGRADDLDAAVLFCFSRGSRFMTGQVIAVDGGWSVSEGQFPAPPASEADPDISPKDPPE